MFVCTEIKDVARHARLFELIRQENLVRATNEGGPERATLGLTEMQNFLKQAQNSLRPDDAW